MIIGFDVETQPINGGENEFSLQPWRVQQGTAEISFAAMVSEKGDRWTYPQCGTLSTWADKGFVKGHTYVAWNAVFDIAWLEAHGNNLEGIKFEDAMLLWKHVDSTQDKKGGYSLAVAVKTFLQEWPFMEEYLALKQREIDSGFQTDETEEYNYLDSQVTVWIYNILRPQLTPRQEVAYLMEQSTLHMVARSWITGINICRESSIALDDKISIEMREIEGKLGLDDTTMRSSKKMSSIIYEEWGCPIRVRTPGGDPSVNAEALAFGAKDAVNMPVFTAWKKLSTIKSKFTRSIGTMLDYTESDKMYPSPKVNSTKTARFTYGSKTLRTIIHVFKDGKTAVRKKEFQNSLAVHQIARRKDVRELFIAPKGKMVMELDASGQEGRFMAAISKDAMMIKMLNEGIDTHSFFGARIIDIPYESFIEQMQAKNEDYCGPQGHRMLGKVGNLSCQYRIGGKTLQIKSMTGYDLSMSEGDAKNIIEKYKETYEGVVEYWRRAEFESRKTGYAEAMDGRRLYIKEWAHKGGWAAAQDAINFPVQGTGAAQKYLALRHLNEKFPEFEFFLDLHDGLYFYVDDSQSGIDRCLEAKEILNTMDYVKHWGVELPIAMPWDCKIGLNRGDMREI